MISATIPTTNLIDKLAKTAQQIGNTPLIAIEGLHDNEDVEIYAKVEWRQLSGSVKARAAFQIISHAIHQGTLNEHKTLLDATSGNTGIAYAAIGKRLGISVTLCLPENASKERIEILQSLGANITFTSKFGGTDEAQETASELAEKYPEQYYYASQYTNDQNWKAHYFGTAGEIMRDVPELDYFVAGLGTSGTFVGTSRMLKEIDSTIQTIALQPDLPLHGLEGWKHMETAIVPKIYDPGIADQVLEINTQEAYDIIRKLYELQGLLISPSSAANIAGALRIAQTITTGTIVTVLPDNADKYSEVINKIIQ